MGDTRIHTLTPILTLSHTQTPRDVRSLYNADGTLCDTASIPLGGRGYIGAYSPEARRERIERFLAKRDKRVWTKKVKYDVRKNFADSRLRVKVRLRCGVVQSDLCMFENCACSTVAFCISDSFLSLTSLSLPTLSLPLLSSPFLPSPFLSLSYPLSFITSFPSFYSPSNCLLHFLYLLSVGSIC
jgi:CCT motif